MLSAESGDRTLASVVMRGIVIATLCYSVAEVLDLSVKRAYILADLSSYIRLRSYRMFLMQELGWLCLSLLGVCSGIGLWKRKPWAFLAMRIWCWLLIVSYLALNLTHLYITSIDNQRRAYSLFAELLRVIVGLTRWAAMPVFFLVLLRNETVLGYFQDNRTKGFEVIPASLPASNDDARS